MKYRVNPDVVTTNQEMQQYVAPGMNCLREVHARAGTLYAPIVRPLGC